MPVPAGISWMWMPKPELGWALGTVSAWRSCDHPPWPGEVGYEVRKGQNEKHMIRSRSEASAQLFVSGSAGPEGPIGAERSSQGFFWDVAPGTGRSNHFRSGAGTLDAFSEK